MNAPFRPDTPLSDARKVHIDRVDIMAAAIVSYRERLSKDPKEKHPLTSQAWLEVCEAACDLFDDGDAMAALEDTRHDMGLDSEGYPIDAPRGFSPSMVHPDDPRQSKGLVPPVTVGGV